MRTAVKIFAALIFLLIFCAGVSLLVLPDATLHGLPGGQGERLVSTKRDAREGAANWFEDVSYVAQFFTWDLTNEDFFDTRAMVEIEIPPDVQKQLRQVTKKLEAQSPNTPKPAPKRPSQPQTEAAPVPAKAAASSSLTSPANTAAKQAMVPKSILAPVVAEEADPSATRGVNEKADDMSLSAVMAKQIPPPPTLAPSLPVANTSGVPKPGAPKTKTVSLMVKTPEKKIELAKVTIPKPASLPKARPPMATPNQVAKVEAREPKKDAAVPAEAQSPAPISKPASSPTLPRTKKLQPKAAKPPATASEDGTDEHQRGMLHYRGNTVPKNLGEAAKWFRIAAKNGHAGAQYNLGIMAFLGQGMTKDYAKAAKWFRMAGEQDHAAAQYNLGFLYYVGRGVAKDDVSAYTWIDRAASLGDKKAQTARDTLRNTLSPEILPK